ncbi:hypothetical protein Pint_35962 [Pistacia integerrima]|uniref:Uncharacterized protein n=1 Tax=Pistacia integerrima TaxID=434235 RepID=A0ACC0Y575_9ROSI|nr:hypothetical protein Pint_35962 [Pistacia integerrima]
MPKVKTNHVQYPEGWELIEPTLRELQAKMREAENDPHDGKKKCETLWPIFKIAHQKSCYIFYLYHRRKEISKELYEFCLDQGYADRNLIAKWKKIRKRDRLLVAYVDGTFAWCHPYQLKPFVENFEEMSKQSMSKNFVSAVQKAVAEIGRLMELKMTCSCVPKESLGGLERPLTMNSGIKQGVLLPECGISKLWTYLFGPSECLSELKRVAQVVSMTNMLEFTELKCWLSAFYRAKGGYQLALFHESQPIPGLKDNDQNGLLDIIHVKNMTEIPIQGPVEEETNMSLLQKCLEASENGQYHRRKQKSIAEIMEGDVDDRAKNVGEDSVKERTGTGNLVTSSARRKRKGNDEANVGSNSSSKPKRRQVTKLLETTQVTGSEIHSDERDGIRVKEEMKKVLLSREKRKSKGSSADNDGVGSKEESNASPMSRERKMIQRDDGHETSDVLSLETLKLDHNTNIDAKKPGYERLCCLRCMQPQDHNFQTTCVCRVPKNLREEKVIECVHCGCRGCASGD